MKSKRLISLLLSVMLLISCVAVANSAVSAETVDEIQPSKDYNLGYSTNDGLILQAWNWSYNDVKANLEAIAEAGFTTIQISPPTELKEATVGVKVLQEANDNGWWMMYQPAAYELNQSEDNVLGTKDELVSMIEAAHELGLFVIADAVINHLGNNETADYKISSTVLPKDANAVDYLCDRAWDFESSKAIIDAGAFHYPYANCKYNDTGAFDCTQNAVSLLPDLDTSHPVVQETILDYWQECIDAGIDGFRIDAAKHIETKYDGEYASDFWDVLMYDGINGKQGIYPYAKDKYGKDLYMYGEILNTVSTERSFSWYLEYMNITNSTAFYGICDAVNGGVAANAVPKSFNNGMTSKTAVLWDESHDTYMDGCKSRSIPTVAQLTKRWACMASRADVVSMYLARPTNTPGDVYSLDLGVAYDTAWNDKETAVINKFHNHFQGSGESVSSYGNIAIVERADSGVVLVNCKGTSGSLTVPVNSIKDGTYIDQMTGNTFTVSEGKISGSIGSTGVAVIYNPETPVVSVSKESCTFTTDTITVDLYANGADAVYTVDDYVYKTEEIPFGGKVTLELQPTYTMASPIEGMMGNVDGDETITIKDATAIQKDVAKISVLDKTALVFADVDGDDNITIKDATAIQKHIAGLDSGCEGIGNAPHTDDFWYNDIILTVKCGDEIKEYTYTRLEEKDANWVRFDNSQTQWPNVYCYMYLEEGGENNAWPGILMTELEDDIWYYQIPEEFIGGTVVFSDNIISTGQQTGNLPTANAQTGELHSNHFIYTEGKWNAIDEKGNYTEIKEVNSDYYIVFTDVYNWKDATYKKIRCCTNNESAPGTEMTFLGTDENGHNQYYLYVDRGCTSVRFYCTNKKTVLKETINCIVSGSSGYYPLSNGSGINCGVFEVNPPA